MVGKIKKNIPNMITITRIITTIMAPILFLTGSIPLAIGLYVYGAMSDFMDGYLARKWQAFTKFGRKLDPISDKLFVLGLIIPSLIFGNLLMIIPLFLEGVISFINLYSESKYKSSSTERVGKFKTVALFPTMILGLLSTIIPELIFIFAPALVISTELQLKTIKTYENKLKEEQNKEILLVENNKENNYLTTNNELSLKDKLIYLRNELSGYLYCEDKEDIKRKELKK